MPLACVLPDLDLFFQPPTKNGLAAPFCLFEPANRLPPWDVFLQPSLDGGSTSLASDRTSTDKNLMPALS